MGLVSTFFSELAAANVSKHFLAPNYTGKWVIPDEDQHYDLAAVNAFGYAYAEAPDSPAKEAKLLEVMECFHGYLVKYLCMIVRGTIPPANSRAGGDAKELLRTLGPRGVKPSKELTDATCKTLHLAFKQQTTEDIYDTPVFCFVKAARQYDPYYADKTRKVCEELYGLQKQFTVGQLKARVGFDCTGILALLCVKAMRLSEQYTCAWSQVFLDKREIRLTKTQNGSHRTVQLNADAVAAIRSLQRPDRRSKDQVFSREGPTFDNRSWLNPCFEDAEIEGGTWHAARHTFCSWLAEAGATAHEIMAAAGHKTSSVSARYTHLNPKHTQSVVDRISSAATQTKP